MYTAYTFKMRGISDLPNMYWEAVVLNNLARKGKWKEYDREEHIVSGRGGTEASGFKSDALNCLVKKGWILKSKHKWGWGYCLNMHYRNEILEFITKNLV